MAHLFRLMSSDEVTNIKCKLTNKQLIAAIVTDCSEKNKSTWCKRTVINFRGALLLVELLKSGETDDWSGTNLEADRRSLHAAKPSTTTGKLSINL